MAWDSRRPNNTYYPCSEGVSHCPPLRGVPGMGHPQRGGKVWGGKGVSMSTDSASEIARRLREMAKGDAYTDTPWWWDVASHGGPADLLNEAAAWIEARATAPPADTGGAV